MDDLLHRGFMDYISRNKYDAFLLQFYNRVSGRELDCASDIPMDAKFFLMNYTYKQLIMPFVREDFKMGKSIKRMQIKYGIDSYIFFREIGKKIGERK